MKDELIKDHVLAQARGIYIYIYTCAKISVWSDGVSTWGQVNCKSCGG